ncbi:MAG: MarR family transcriptional regulator [Alicyclobacillus macrosporangiidus]|nr:MarR family transcriptional regulator [Alicyclobacillus macrosporangiidus]
MAIMAIEMAAMNGHRTENFEKRGGSVLDRELRIQLMMSYRKLHFAFKNKVRLLAEAFGLNESHFLMLSALAHHEEISLRQLAALIATSESQASIAVEELVVRGCIDRIRKPGDRRRLVLRLTDAGRQVLCQAFAENSPIDQEMSRIFDLSQEEAELLIHLNQRILANLQREGASHS